ncbi:MAG: hypothetical protein LJE74_07850 [Proteobacteria bacterium]|nr:hypothetical protein [Pseudomonadota bacterium]MCG6934607.1 hypothetical protein [Pseudomonadota bacterium]
MKRKLLAILAPPVAVCRYGCAACCAAPIGVFWITGIVSLVYAFFGGPTGVDGLSLGTLGLGFTLWGIAAVWSANVIKGVDEENTNCQPNSSSLCNLVKPAPDDSDPLDEVKKFHH